LHCAGGGPGHFVGGVFGREGLAMLGFSGLGAIGRGEVRAPSEWVGWLLIVLGLACFLAAAAPVPGAEPANWNATPAVQVTVPASAGPVVDALAAADAERTPAATRGFKNTLNAAATAAFREGKITRWQLARLRLAITFRPDAMAEAQACVVDQGIQDGVLLDGSDAIKDGFDWSQLMAFIQRLLPLILQIIAVFQ
jgi:hypothetical protein